MLPFLEILTAFLVAVTMTFALAHAAELPGKMRLGKDTYLAVQPIYYPGFTIGAFSEPAAIVATLVLFVVTWVKGVASWELLAAFALLFIMHAVYWTVTHPVNNFWLSDQKLTGVSAGFVSLGATGNPANRGGEDWKRLRNRWEYSHVARAALCVLSLILVLVAVTT